MTPWAPELLLLVTGVFLLAGLVKGVVGLGLPTIALALLTATVGLREAVALMVVPSLLTNLWQGAVGGHLRVLLGRLWSLLLAAVATVWLGTGLLARLDPALLSGLLGLTLLAYAAIGLAGVRPRTPSRFEPWLSPLVGMLNGAITGLTGSFVVPGTPYLQSLGLARDALVQAMGILYTVSTFALALALGARGLFPTELGVLSTLAVLPALAGMAVGARIRSRLGEARFRRTFDLSLVALGGWIVLDGALRWLAGANG